MSGGSKPWTVEEREAYLEGLRFVFEFWKGLAGWEAAVLRALPSDSDPKSGYTGRIHEIYAEGRPVADAVDFVRRKVIRTHDVWQSLSEDEVARLAVLEDDRRGDCHDRIRDIHMRGGTVEEVVAQIRQEIGAATSAPAP